MRIPNKAILGLALAGALSVGVVAHVRLIYTGNGQELAWSNPANVSIVIQSVGSDDVMDSSDEMALRNSIDEWNSAGHSTAQLVENTSAGEQARTDWASDSIHLMTFDENNTSGFFPPGSGVVAITPLEFFTSGTIIDADVLFNGKDFRFTTDGTGGRFDIQDVATHELGHLLGLDHSGVAGATMYPYVDPTVILHRSLGMDDIHGLRDMYPSQTFASISGNLKRNADQTAVAGGYIVVRDSAGRTVGSALADEAGAFRVEALDAGTYSVWATPLDSPVSVSNLTAGHTIHTNFEAASLGQAVVNAAQNTAMGNTFVDGDVSLSLGRVADDYPLRVVENSTVSRLIRGSGLNAGSTLTSPGTGITITPTVWTGSAVQFNVTVPNGAPLGHLDLLVTDSFGNQDLLAGALEITPADPTVTNVVPSSGLGGGGYTVTLTGTGFRSGCRVVIGNQIYKEGAPGGCTLINSTEIQLTLASTVAGPHDVVVIDATGVEGRDINAFSAQANPSIATIFPAVGASAGGTEVTLTGENFVPGATLTINGVPQASVVATGPTTLTFETVAALPGGPHVVTLTNPGGDQASTAFLFSPEIDPVLSAVTPNSGPAGGGTTTRLFGTGFSGSTQVIFGADPFTGVGGVAATQVTVVSGNELLVVSPAKATSFNSVHVEDALTEQASMEPAAFSYDSPASFSEDFSFGGCHASARAGEFSWRHLFEGSGWMALLYGILGVRLLIARRP
ncbi:MAG: IPT/TIG domain-containing protein [Planctomycetota bacterium]|nr:IPT/TIG domain-containing protein [Planctomycetota bacterium]